MRTLVGTKKGQRYDVMLALLALFVLPIYYYGVRVLIMLALALVTAIVVDFAARKIFKYKPGRRVRYKIDNTSIITAMICTLLLSAAVPYWMVVVTVAIALLVGKYPFGGREHNIFNPAAVGLTFVGLCWPELVFQYPEPMQAVDLSNRVGGKLVHSMEYQLGLGGVPSVDKMDVILGKFAGPMGATLALVLFACGIYLLVRRTISIHITASLLITTSLMVVIAPRISSSLKATLGYELVAGVLLFGSVFLANDPTTTPTSKLGKVYFGIVLGLLTTIFKYYGVNEYGFLYALLIANALSSFCDSLADHTISLWKRRRTPKKSHPIGEEEKA
ncbi:RnfABCDGE type electron transport complex subunit D [Massilioclostridium coli]|uniref:RnfABCDGE type electron transport complex subunit D n=1 Tax=Massilioclostridium coli TaxID=1870991 RepID=UPI00085CAA8A|nr:RnfABCDGE type electron transport complex subunit D [Massilioclostridium coli]